MDPPPDVQLVLAHDKILELHSSVLARHSKRFAGLLMQENAAKLSRPAKQKGVTICWRIELRGAGVNGTSVGRLIARQLDASGKLIQNDSYGPMIPLNENGKVPTKYFDYYKGIIGTYYGRELGLSDFDIQSALESAVGLINIAEYLGSVSAISRHIDYALVRQGQILFRSIANNPIEWIDLAVRLSSDIIFKECLIHIVGRWNEWNPDQKAGMSNHVKRIAKKHVDKLNRQRRNTEMELGVMYLGGMAQPPNPAGVKRGVYAANIMMWMAVCLFRQWLMQRILQDRDFRAEDGGYEMYKSMADGRYLSREACQPFFTNFPMTKKGLNVFENHLLELKETVKGKLAKSGLLESEANLDPKKHEVHWLTCTVVEPKDYPWIKTAPEQSGQKRTSRLVGDEDDEDEDWEMDEDENVDNKRARSN